MRRWRAWRGCGTSGNRSSAAVDVDQGRKRVLTGAALFLPSDALIAVRRFIAHDRGDLLGLAVMATYVGAQWSIAEGMACTPEETRGLPSVDTPRLRVGVSARLV
jgi:hypothetical protein